MKRDVLKHDTFIAENGKRYTNSIGWGELKPVKNVYDGYCELLKAIRARAENDLEMYEKNKIYDGDGNGLKMIDEYEYNKTGNKKDKKLKRYNPRVEYKLFCRRLAI